MKDQKKTSTSWPFALPVDGWYHLAPRGEFPGWDEIAQKPVTQVLDDDSFSAIIAAFKKQASAENFAGLLIDYDHFSEDPDKSSEASGWITELQARDDGLWFRVRWSNIGESNLKSGCYRFISPVFDGGYIDPSHTRPLRLLGAGLTNDPNFKTLRPLSNRAKGQQKPQRKETTMNKLLELLGLAPEASEDSAIAKVKELLEKIAGMAKLENRATTAESALKTLKDSQLKSDADDFCDTNKARIKNRDAVHAQFIKDPDGTKALFAGLEEGSPHTTLHNRVKKQPGKDEPATAQINADLLEGKVQEFRSLNRCSYQHAFDSVSRANPDLLKTETQTDD